MGREKTKVDPAIIAAWIGAAALILAALIAVFAPRLFDATPTPITGTPPIVTIDITTTSPTSTSTATQADLGNVLFEEDFEGIAFDNFGFMPLGSGSARVIAEDTQNHVFEAKNLSNDSSTETFIRLEDEKTFSNGYIEFRFKYIEFIKTGEEDDGGLDFHFRLQGPEESYVLAIRAASSTIEVYYVRPDGEWASPIDYATFQFVLNQWYSVRIKAIGNQIEIFLDRDLDNNPAPVIAIEDTRLEAGEVDLAVRQNIYVHFDDIQVIEQP